MDAGQARWLVPLQQPERPRLRLLCFPYSGGGASVYASWRSGLPADVEVLAVELPGRGRRAGEPAVQRMDDVAQGVAACLSQREKLPLMIFGHSLGAILGFELARLQLEREEQAVHLFASGAVAPHLFKFPHATELSDAELLENMNRLGLSGLQAMTSDPEFMRVALQVVRSDLRLVADYVYRKSLRLPTRITVFSAGSDDTAPFSAVDAWREHTHEVSHFQHHHYSGGHDFVEKERAALLLAIAEVAEACVRETSPNAARLSAVQIEEVQR